MACMFVSRHLDSTTLCTHTVANVVQHAVKLDELILASYSELQPHSRCVFSAMLLV